MPPAPQDVVYRELARYLGPHTAKNALKTFAGKAVGKAPESLTLNDVPDLLAAMRPMLRVLLGAKETDEVLEHLRHELRL